MTYYALGPIKPKKKPRPKPIKFEGGNIAFIDGEDNFTQGVQIWVCLDEDTAEMGLLQTNPGGVPYVTLDEFQVQVIDGVIDEIAS